MSGRWRSRSRRCRDDGASGASRSARCTSASGPAYAGLGASGRSGAPARQWCRIRWLAGPAKRESAETWWSIACLANRLTHCTTADERPCGSSFVAAGDAVRNNSPEAAGAGRRALPEPVGRVRCTPADGPAYGATRSRRKLPLTEWPARTRRSLVRLVDGRASGHAGLRSSERADLQIGSGAGIGNHRGSAERSRRKSGGPLPVWRTA
jgi:hypothetical protein